MPYISRYSSPMGDMLLAADGQGLTGAWFEGQKYFARGLEGPRAERETPPLRAARRWLEVYFSGREPDFSVPLHLVGTEFQKEVWQILLSIPYGRTMTYGEIAGLLAQQRGKAHLSAQAVGGAVGRNKLSIFVPCHRVIGAGGTLTGYAGGIDKKAGLLALEGAVWSASAPEGRAAPANRPGHPRALR